MEQTFTYVAVYEPPPGEGFTRYATVELHRSDDRKYWTDENNFHRYVMDDYGILKHAGYNNFFN